MEPRVANFPIAREGLAFIVPLAVISVVLWALGVLAGAGLFTLATLFILYFFRNPEREIPPGEHLVLSPADGTVVQIESCLEDRLLKGPAVKISIFMSVFDVHVNRNPLSGRIVENSYSRGQFIRADRNQASVSNEQNALLVENGAGVRLVVVQIAGILARRIVCWVKRGDQVERGRRFGLICFGSRLDVYLPEKTPVQVRLGQKTRAGQTILGTLA